MSTPPTFQEEGFQPATSNFPRLFDISSGQNPRYKAWRSLLDGRGIKKQQEAIVSGPKIIREILTLFSQRATGLILRHPDELNTLSGAPLPPPETGFSIFQVTPELFAPLDIYGIDAPLLVITAPPLPIWDETLPPGLTLFLPFQNPLQQLYFSNFHSPTPKFSPQTPSQIVLFFALFFHTPKYQLFFHKL